jgi:hypothetical protein
VAQIVEKEIAAGTPRGAPQVQQTVGQLVGSVMRPVVTVGPIVGVRRIGRRVINGRRRRIVGIARRVVCVGHWIGIAAIPTSSPANYFYGGL